MIALGQNAMCKLLILGIAVPFPRVGDLSRLPVLFYVSLVLCSPVSPIVLR